MLTFSRGSPYQLPQYANSPSYVCTTYFEFKGDIYEQKEGAAMGSPLSLVPFNTYMEIFEDEASDSAAYKP